MKSTLGSIKDIFVRLLSTIGLLVVIFFIVGIILVSRGINSLQGPEQAVFKKNSILVLDLRGVIIDGRRFLKDLRKYRDKDSIKGIIVRIDSPGGVVGPSQEIYSELKRAREEFKKPIVASVSGLAASGAYYSAVAADKIITNPGSLMGSIGVIMEFANLEDLYSWAKIKRYSLKTGKYKDAGADYRKMTEEERSLFQGMINDVLEQFIKAVADGRKLTPDRVRMIADGRVITGEQAVKLGLADEIGTFTDAVRVAGEMAGLGKDPELFIPPKEKPSPLEFFKSLNDEDAEEESKSLVKVFDGLTRRQILGKPLFLMPGASID